MNYYEILQITPDASDEVIKAAYKALVKKYHPDNGTGFVDCTEKLMLFNEAYEVLSNLEKRKRYDEDLQSSVDYAMGEAQSYRNDDVEKAEHTDCNYNDVSKSLLKSKLESIVLAVFSNISQEVQRNRRIVENAYYEGLQMSDYELVHSFKKNYGLIRQGYTKVLEERGFFTRDYEGNLKPTDKFRDYWR